MQGIGVSISVLLIILIGSHLTIDSDFPKEVKMGTYVVLIVIGLVYIFFGLI